jgi:NADPH:quinone reductase-like Zn-dependent oxidoreductase
MNDHTSVTALMGKAVVYKGPGDYDVIDVLERSVPPPGEGEVRIAVKAAAVNPTDGLLRKSGTGDPTARVTPGMDAAGIVESVGSGVTRLRVGDEVMAVVMPRRPEGGAQAEYIVVPAASVVPIPLGVSLAQASTLPMNGLTALRALELAGLARGEWLAVSGGAGLLAHYAIAAAKRQGYKVIADARAEDVALVRGYGAHIVVERGADFSAAVRKEMHGGVDALLDTASLGEAAFGAIRDGGSYIPVRGWNGVAAERDIAVKPVFVFEVLDRTDWLQSLREMVEASEIQLKVVGEYPPERVGDAQRAQHTGGMRGRPVIVFG